jgi:hypothetical protein
MLTIDHAIIAVQDPTATAEELVQRGLRAIPGGRHPGHGTGNWIVPLGSTYLELMTVIDADEAEGSPMGRWMLRSSRHGDRLAAVCLRTDAIDEVAHRIGYRPEPMSREREDGTVLRWRLAGLEAAMSDEHLPFFITWDADDDQHPGRMPVDHDVTVDGISWIEYGGDPKRLAEWLGDHSLPIRSVDEQPGPRRLAIATADGPVIIAATGPI